MRAKLIIAGWMLALMLTTYTGVSLLIWGGIIALMGVMTYLMNRYWWEVAREVIRMERRVMAICKKLTTK
ncbi:hypothetical protein [Dysgonomonas termitidis]|uniref:Uncharacterized protein n=1 Tax=Dysgonomonas termitidis TaxID=1516126 RepID=A0ABV9KU86_9BACT